jgi:hypothetical protein
MGIDRPVVVTRSYGGLGNQMFQYAAGMSVASRLGASLHVDTLWFDPKVHPRESPPQRRYGLGVFGVPERIPARARLLLKLRRPTVIKEKALFSYDPRLAAVAGSVVLDGYWQSYRYFEHIAEEVRRVFRLPPASSHAGRRLLADCADPNCVAIHVRRGDYASNPKLTRIFGVLSDDYYRAAAAEIRRRVGSRLRYLVFSDDIEWCKRNATLATLGDVAFVEGTAADTEDLLLLSSCTNHIIANSSFGWWGAWLAADPDKIVVAPVPWAREPRVDGTDLIPPGWLRLGA